MPITRDKIRPRSRVLRTGDELSRAARAASLGAKCEEQTDSVQEQLPDPNRPDAWRDLPGMYLHNGQEVASNLPRCRMPPRWKAASGSTSRVLSAGHLDLAERYSGKQNGIRGPPQAASSSLTGPSYKVQIAVRPGYPYARSGLTGDRDVAVARCRHEARTALSRSKPRSRSRLRSARTLTASFTAGALSAAGRSPMKSRSTGESARSATRG